MVAIVPLLCVIHRCEILLIEAKKVLLNAILTKEMKNSNLFQLSTHYCENFKTSKLVSSMNVTGIFRDDAMLRQITKSVLIKKVEEGKLINFKSEWNYVSIPKGCCDAVASLETWLRAAIFRVLLHEVCVFFRIFIYVQLTRSLTKLVLKFWSFRSSVEISLSFSFPLLRWRLCNSYGDIFDNSRNRNVIYHKIPSAPELKKLWLQRIRSEVKSVYLSANDVITWIFKMAPRLIKRVYTFLKVRCQAN